MKINKNQLRKIIVEEYMKGVQEHQFVSLTDDYVDHIRDLLKRHIYITKSTTQAERTKALAVANVVLKEFEKNVNDLLQDTLNKFNQNS